MLCCRNISYIECSTPETYWGPCQTSKVELFVEIINGLLNTLHSHKYSFIENISFLKQGAIMLCEYGKRVSSFPSERKISNFRESIQRQVFLKVNTFFLQNYPIEIKIIWCSQNVCPIIIKSSQMQERAVTKKLDYCSW